MTKLTFFKTEGSVLAGEVREKVAMYIMGGLGIVIGLAWNEAIKGLIEYFFPYAGAGTTIAKFMYAIILTIVVVIIAHYLVHEPKKREKKNTG